MVANFGIGTLAFRLSVFYGAYFAYLGLSLPFMPAWFAARGLEPGEIGIVLATPLVVRVLVVPVASRLADRSALRQALFASAAASVVGFALVGLCAGFFAILAAYALAAALVAPVLPLGDAYALRGLRDRMGRYGPVRLWGSVSFILANLVGGVLLARLGADHVIWAVVAALALTAAAALALAPRAPAPAQAAARPATASLWRSPAAVAVMAGASLIQASHAVLYGFATLQWSARGIGGSAIGALWAIGVIAEVGLFALSGRLGGRLGAPAMIALGGAGGLVRWTVMALDPPTASLPFLQALHALSFAATHLGSMQFLARAAPEGRNATAQGDFVALQGIVFAAAMGLAGTLVAAYGSLAYVAMAAACVAGALLALAAPRLSWSVP
ncbi:MAG TPA: MFS transporter [Xanthobacteraceae bacterium]|nr:MFS transporter [Xanthobacteraceae bacterium]